MDAPSMRITQRARILVVDDHLDSRTVAIELMLQAGYEVMQAANGMEALQIAEKLRFDAIVIDFSMPGMDGAELTRRLRQDPRMCHIPIIMVTAHASEAFRANALTA